MWPFSKSKVREPRAAPVLPCEVLEAGILASNGKGVHMAMLYATMLGFEHQTLLEQEAKIQFIELVQSPPNFTELGIKKAALRVANDADSMCSGPSFESFVYGPQNSKNQQLKPLLEPYRIAIKEFGAAQVFAAAGFDVEAFVIKKALERREGDLCAIFGKLDEKRPFLMPLLMRARARGRNRYGDLDYSDFIDELADFLKTYFSEDNLHFFITIFHSRSACSMLKRGLPKQNDYRKYPLTESILNIGAQVASKSRVGMSALARHQGIKELT